MKEEPILRLENICKIFPGGVEANKDASLTVHKGEIHAIVGENGAGKSTLMNILYGVHQADSGSIFSKALGWCTNILCWYPHSPYWKM